MVEDKSLFLDLFFWWLFFKRILAWYLNHNEKIPPIWENIVCFFPSILGKSKWFAWCSASISVVWGVMIWNCDASAIRGKEAVFLFNWVTFSWVIRQKYFHDVKRSLRYVTVGMTCSHISSSFLFGSWQYEDFIFEPCFLFNCQAFLEGKSRTHTTATFWDARCGCRARARTGLRLWKKRKKILMRWHSNRTGSSSGVLPEQRMTEATSNVDFRPCLFLTWCFL